MGQSFKIRELRPADGRGLIRNYYGYYAELSGNPSFGLSLFEKKPSRKDELKWFGSLLRGVRNGSRIASVAEMDGRVVGLCNVDKSSVGGQSHIGTLGIAIVKEARGRGIGEALMRDVIGKCRGRLEKVKLAVFADNVAAKRLYRKLGFKRYGSLKEAIKRSGRYFDEEFMCLDLSR